MRDSFEMSDIDSINNEIISRSVVYPSTTGMGRLNDWFRRIRWSE